MKSLYYSWLTFQIMIGVWLFLSPFVLSAGQFAVTSDNMALNNMVFGALVGIVGIGMVLYEVYHQERHEKGTYLLRNLLFSWIAFQMAIGVWLFISPYLLGYPGTHMAYNDMLFGVLTIVVGIGTLFFQLFHKEEFETLEHAEERARS